MNRMHKIKERGSYYLVYIGEYAVYKKFNPMEERKK